MQVDETPTDPEWAIEVIQYLQNGLLPEDKAESQKVKLLSASEEYYIVESTHCHYSNVYRNPNLNMFWKRYTMECATITRGVRCWPTRRFRLVTIGLQWVKTWPSWSGIAINAKDLPGLRRMLPRSWVASPHHGHLQSGVSTLSNQCPREKEAESSWLLLWTTSPNGPKKKHLSPSLPKMWRISYGNQSCAGSGYRMCSLPTIKNSLIVDLSESGVLSFTIRITTQLRYILLLMDRLKQQTRPYW